MGIFAGSIAALKQNSKWDYASMALAMLGISVPNFVLGPILVLIFSLTLYWLPPSRWYGFASKAVLLPILTLSAVYMAYIARLTRAGMLEVLRSDYIRTARSKGLSERDVLLRHALRGGLMPVVSYTGPALAFLLTGTVVVEAHFCFAGAGKLFHSGFAESRRAANHRHRCFHRDDPADHEPAGRHRLRVPRSTHTLLKQNDEPIIPR